MTMIFIGDPPHVRGGDFLRLGFKQKLVQGRFKSWIGGGGDTGN